MSESNPVLNTNANLLQATKFRMVFARLPNVEYMLTNIVVPGVMLPPAVQPTPFRERPMPGNMLQWGQLEIAFNITESLVNWRELFNWIKAIGKQKSFDDYKSVRDPKIGLNNVYSDASLVILSSHNNANIRINFVDCWPSMLSPINFTTMGSANEPIQATATFFYLNYDIETV